ncbi:MAG: hypothetical protein U9R75_09185 [Candidatus Thermoplasmatota archaeon]|nr:hypothetical protein [Candidatus Thermoplasmatota archaeon]
MVHLHRRRYLVFHVVSPGGVGKGLLINMIRNRTREMSEEDFNRVRPWFVYYGSGWAIVRTWHRGVDDLVGMVKDLEGKELKEGILKINIAGTSGTLKRAFYKFIPGPVRERSHYREHQKK